MRLPASICSLVRKTTGIKGTTWHTGRGAYRMEFTCDHAEVLTRLEDAAHRWERNGYIERITREAQVRDSNNYYSYSDVYVFKEHLVRDGQYRTLRMFNSNGNVSLIVWM